MLRCCLGSIKPRCNVDVMNQQTFGCRHVKSGKWAGIALVMLFSLTPLPALAVALHPGDKVTITVYNHPELLTQGQLDEKGDVTVPLAGTVKIGGLEPAQADAAIAEALRKYVRYPAVDVSVTAPSTTIFVAGGPGGTANYAPGEHLSAFANSLTLSSGVDLHKVELDRDGHVVGTYDLSGAGRGDNGPVLEPGDTVAFSNKPVQVDVRGDVKQPGTTSVYAGEDLGDAIGQVGGFNDDSARGIIELRRGGTVQVVTPQAPAQDGDVIDVHAAQHVAVGGQVAKPGDVALVSGNTLIAAIYDAGGPLPTSDFSHVTLLHDGVQKTYDVAAVGKGDLSQNPQVASGDIIFVPKGNRIDFFSAFSALATLRYFWIP
jgi:polysaccharide biosynthesis/export protein